MLRTMANPSMMLSLQISKVNSSSEGTISEEHSQER
jgi:hypothetical protein